MYSYRIHSIENLIQRELRALEHFTTIQRCFFTEEEITDFKRGIKILKEKDLKTYIHEDIKFYYVTFESSIGIWHTRIHKTFYELTFNYKQYQRKEDMYDQGMVFEMG